MTTEENKLLVRHFFETAFIEHDLESASQMLTHDYELHDPARPVFGGGRHSFRNVQQPYIDAFDNHLLSVDDQLAEGDKVVTRWTVKGTQRADLPGIPNRGKNFLISGITISRVQDGHIAEEWQVWDDAGLKQQLLG
jgi:steroid delta-isomerase-like uncharacterized protein